MFIAHEKVFVERCGHSIQLTTCSLLKVMSMANCFLNLVILSTFCSLIVKILKMTTGQWEEGGGIGGERAISQGRANKNN